MQINIPGTHQRHSILLNIFPLGHWRECCRSSQQSRKSQTDSSIGNNGQNQSRLRENTRYLVFVLLGASPVLFLYHTFQLRDLLSDSITSKSYCVHPGANLHVANINHLLISLPVKKHRVKSWLFYSSPQLYIVFSVCFSVLLWFFSSK